VTWVTAGCVHSLGSNTRAKCALEPVTKTFIAGLRAGASGRWRETL
jgi:hypothetical protein